MSHTSNTSIAEAYLRDRPDIFSRGTLDASFNILREEHPALALKVRNILATEKIEHPELTPEAEYFPINLDGPSIEEVISALSDLSEYEVDQSLPDPGKLIILKTLLQDWLALAEYLIDRKLLHPKEG